MSRILRMEDIAPSNILSVISVISVWPYLIIAPSNIGFRTFSPFRVFSQSPPIAQMKRYLIAKKHEKLRLTRKFYLTQKTQKTQKFFFRTRMSRILRMEDIAPSNILSVVSVISVWPYLIIAPSNIGFRTFSPFRIFSHSHHIAQMNFY